ncbi:MAG: prepilin-type N-terminal cleavage/methylation domain-containing protein [Verrucomicrobiota bacterium]
MTERKANSRRDVVFQGTRAFTLLEVLVALAVFTIAAFGLTQALAQMGLASVDAAEAEWRTEILQATLEEVSKGKRVEKGTREIEVDREGYWIEEEVRSLDLKGKKTVGSLPDLFDIELRLWREAEGGKSELVDTVRTWRYGPLYAK